VQFGTIEVLVAMRGLDGCLGMSPA